MKQLLFTYDTKIDFTIKERYIYNKKLYKIQISFCYKKPFLK